MKKNKIRCWTIHVEISKYRKNIENLIKIYSKNHFFFLLDGIFITTTNFDSIIYVIFENLYVENFSMTEQKYF